jgi:O-antigen ligase
VAALNTIGNYATGTLAKQSSKTVQRFAATGFNPNDLGFLLAIALPMAWYFGVQEPRWWMRWANRLYLPAGVMAIILTGSRGALISAIVGCGLILPWTLPRVPRRTRIVVVALLFISAIVVLRHAPETSIERLATTRSEVMEGTLNKRKEIWAAALGIVPRNPMLGVGTGTFKQAVLPVLGFEKTAHNSFLEILVEAGIVGLVLFLLMLFAAFYRALTAPRRVRPLLLTVFFTLGVGLMPRAAGIEKTTWVLLAFLIYPTLPAAAAPAPAAGPVLRPGRVRQPVGAARTITSR